MRTQKYTSGKCSTSGGQSGTTVKTIGIVLMVVGGLILLISVPIKFWFALVGLLLLVFGFILWRLG